VRGSWHGKGLKSEPGSGNAVRGGGLWGKGGTGPIKDIQGGKGAKTGSPPDKQFGAPVVKKWRNRQKIQSERGRGQKGPRKHGGGVNVQNINLKRNPRKTGAASREN